MAYIDLTRQKEINNIVEDIRIKTGYSYPEKNIVNLANDLGISVFEVNFSDHPSINAMIVFKDSKNNDKPSIYLKKDLSETRKRFTLAHELGHFLLHKKANVKFRLEGFDYSSNSEYSREETEANYFAACILVPEEELKKLMKFFDKNIQLIADYFGVSKEVIENRIKWLRMNPIA